MSIADPYAFLLAGFSQSDVEEIMADLDYLHGHAAWPYTLDRTRQLVVESPDIMLEFLLSVERSAVSNAMISSQVKAMLR